MAVGYYRKVAKTLLIRAVSRVSSEKRDFNDLIATKKWREFF